MPVQITIRAVPAAVRDELAARAATSLARLWQRQAKRATTAEASAKEGAARDLVVPVCAWFSEGFATRDLRKAKARLAELGT